MQKIDSNGATVTNEFTEGNAALSIPATVVSGPWLNAVQRELVNVIEGVGLTLEASGDGSPGNQLMAAIKQLITQGGQTAALSMVIANNQASAADVVGFPQIDVSKVRSFEAFITLVRRTDSGFVQQSGRLYGTWMTAAELGLANGAWTLSFQSVHDDAGVNFSMVLVGGLLWKLQYVSDNMAGASYLGSLKITDIKYNLI